jgi:undecaprenyl-diphosphatase
MAVVVYFRGDIAYLTTRTFGLRGDPVEVVGARQTVALLALGSIPAAIVGLLFRETFEEAFRRPQLVGGFLLVTAALLTGAEWIRRRRLVAATGISFEEARDRPDAEIGRDETTVGARDAAAIGLAQALSIFPGISRAGATIATGMGLGLSRGAATRFSFLLSIPIVLGATLVEFTRFTGEGGAGGAYGGGEVIAGVLTAAIAGYWAISFLIKLVAREDLIGFARYVALLGALTYVGYLWLGPESTI